MILDSSNLGKRIRIYNYLKDSKEAKSSFWEKGNWISIRDEHLERAWLMQNFR